MLAPGLRHGGRQIRVHVQHEDAVTEVRVPDRSEVIEHRHTANVPTQGADAVAVPDAAR